MKQLLIQFIPQILGMILTTLLGLLTYSVKQFFNAKKDLIENQRAELIQKIGVDNYNKDVSIAKNIILSIEQQAKEYKWDSTIKHAKAAELIANKTGLSTDEVFNIIKATVAEFNTKREKTY